jgi:hypothetical protein
MTVKVTSEVSSYDEPAKTNIQVHSHWNNRKLVVLEFQDGQKRTVSARELTVAIENATNTGGL